MKKVGAVGTLINHVYYAIMAGRQNNTVEYTHAHTNLPGCAICVTDGGRLSWEWRLVWGDHVVYGALCVVAKSKSSRHLGAPHWVPI